MSSRARTYATFVALFVFASVVGATSYKVVAVNSVDALYNAVNDPANHDAEIRIMGGRTYLLSPARQLPNGKSVARPKEGRLVLQRGMSLVGENTYLLVGGRPAPRDVSGEVYADPASETILDGSALLGGAPGPGGSAGVVQIGRDNAVRRLTIRSNEEAKAAITVDQLGKSGMTAEVSDCTLEGGSSGGRRGVMIYAIGSDFFDTSTTVTVQRSVIRHHRAAFGFGVQAVRSETSGLHVGVDLHDNVVYDNNTGLFVPNLGTHETTTDVTSRNNVYRSNNVGIDLIGGRDFIFPVGSIENLIVLASADDEITNNFDAGVAAIGGLRDDSIAPENSGNVVSLTFAGTRFIGARGPQNGEPAGQRLDLWLNGALSEFAPDQGAGVNNQVKVLLTGLAASPVPGESVYVYFLDSDVPEPSNQVIFVGGVGALPGHNPAIPVIVFQ